MWGLFSCCGLFGVAIGLFFVKGWVDEKLNWRRWRRLAPRLLEDPPPPLPPELGPGREDRAWRGGYLEGGALNVQETALRLLRHGIVRPAVVIEANHRGDADDWVAYIVYAFRDLNGAVAVRRTVSSVNPWGAAVSQGSGAMEPAFDAMDAATTVGWLHVLLDPLSTGHIIYESLLVTTRGAPAAAPPPPPARTQRLTFFPEAPRDEAPEEPDDASFPPAPQNLHHFARPPAPPTSQVEAPPGLSEVQTLRHALARFPTLATSEDNSDCRVVADLLLERGFARGELIALQTHDQQATTHRARIAELLRTHAAAWLPPGTSTRRFEFRRGFAWSVTLEQPTDVQHLEWAFIRHLAVSSPGGPGLFDGFEQLPLVSMTGVGRLALWYLVQGHVPRGVQHLELALQPQEAPELAAQLQQLPPLALLALRSRRQEVSAAALAAMLDALPTPARVRLVLQWGDVRGFQREVARRAWLRTLELVSLESTAGTLMLEISASSMRVVTTGRPDATGWKGLSAGLRAQGFTSIPLHVSETGETREQPLA